jgi:hypothetical protein
MTLDELFRLKERLLKNLCEETKESDFPNHQEYEKHLISAQEGIMKFYVHTMMELVDAA